MEPWRTDTTPYLREIMDADDDPRVRQITIIKGSQTGGTEALYNIIGYAIDRKPGLTMFVYPDADSAREQNRIRFMPMIRSTPALLARLGPNSRDAQTMSVRFDRMDILWRGAASEHKVESFPCPKVVVDELDRCPLNTAHLARQRIKTFADGKLIVCGKPGLEGQGVDLEWSKSDQRRYHVPCPHCGAYHVRTFNRVRWWGEQSDGTTGPDSRDIETDPFQGERTACFKCPNNDCRKLIGPEFNRWQLSLGVWAGSTQGVEPLQESGAFDPEVNDPRDRWSDEPGRLIGDAPDTDHAGFHVPGLITGLRPNPYAECVAEFLRRKGKIDQDFVTDQLGEAWKPVAEKLDDTGLAKHAVAKAHGGYAMGEIPAGVRLLIASIDVQVRGAYVEVRGYGDYGRDRWLIWREYVGCPDKMGLDPLDEVLYRRNFGRLKIAARFIDSGDRTDEVYRYCAKRPRIFAVKGYAGGRGQGKMQTPYDARQIEKGPDGIPLGQRIWLVKVNTAHFKNEVARRLRAITEETEASGDVDPQELIDQELGRGGLGRWYFPEDAGDDYFRQLTGEECRTRLVNGRTEYEWVKRVGRENHYLDCAVYNEAGFAWVRGAERLRPAGEQTTPNPPAREPEDKPGTRSLSRSPLLERARSMRRS